MQVRFGHTSIEEGLDHGMSDIILVVHVLLAIGLIGSVLLQRSEGGGLGIGGGGSGFVTGRGKVNILTKITMSLAAAFMVTSIVLSILAAGGNRTSSIVDDIPAVAPGASQGSDSSEPSVPIE